MRPCPHAPACPGCALIDRPYAEQLAAKRARVVAELARFPSVCAIDVDEAPPAPRPLGYRTRARLAVGAGAVGLFAAGTHDVVDTPACRVLSPALLEAAAALRAALGAGASVRHVELREDAAGAVGLTLVTHRVEADARWPVQALRRACPRLASVAVNYNPIPDKQILGPETRVIWGAATLPAESGGREVRLRPGTFFQANPPVLEQAHALMRAHFAGRAATLLDLFAGAGAHALALADLADEVVAVEEVPGAVADGAATFAAHGLGHARFVQAAVEDALRAGLPARAPLFVVLNPSRRGVRPEALEAVAARAPARLAYLSCAPFTLARDLDVLVRSGLRVDRVVPLDMLPQTDHVETLALLSWGGAPAPDAAVVYAFGPRPATDLPPGVSGEAAPGGPWLALVKGVAHRGGAVPVARGGARFRRVEVAGGHSLLRVEAGARPAADLLAGLRRMRHPVVGAGDDGPTDRFFERKLHLARPFLHRGEALPPELAVVLEALRAR